MQVAFSSSGSVYAAAPVALDRRIPPLGSLQGAAEHDPATCPHCLAGALHTFSADRDESVISPAARQAREPNGSDQPDGGEQGNPTEAPRSSVAAAGGKGLGAQELTAEEVELVRELAARDREVRAHEQAHLAAAGGYATGGPSYTYQTGPDGGRYAIGGEVSIDTSEVPGDPRATLAKARTIIAAANAPAEPSGQDRAVSAAAAQMAARAQAELSQAVAAAAYAAPKEQPQPSIDLSF